MDHSGLVPEYVCVCVHALACMTAPMVFVFMLSNVFCLFYFVVCSACSYVFSMFFSMFNASPLGGYHRSLLCGSQVHRAETYNELVHDAAAQPACVY